MPTVQKTDHSFELFDPIKIKTRLERVLAPHHKGVVNVNLILERLDKGLPDGISTARLDELVVQVCDALTIEHPYYKEVGGRIMLTRHRKTNPLRFSEVTHQNRDLLDPDFESFVHRHAETLNGIEEEVKGAEGGLEAVNPDLTTDTIRTLTESYFRPGERYETLLMRVAVGVWMETGKPPNLEMIRKSFKLMLAGYYTHATPTLFNAGTLVGQLASCFLLPVESDSIKGMYGTLCTMAQMSQAAGGIGVGMAKIRAAGSKIRTGGKATGVPGLLPTYNKMLAHCDQGRQRDGVSAITIPLWHLDALDVCTIQHPIQPPGREKLKHLFPALWVNELFHKRVKANGPWSFFCPTTAPLLLTTYGADFEAAYEAYESQGLARKTLPARKVLTTIARLQLESGAPYIHNADLINRCSNVRQIEKDGVHVEAPVAHSNLCAEIVQPSTPENPALCNLASINLRRFVIKADGDGEAKFDFPKLKEVVAHVVRSLDRVIEVTKLFDEEMRLYNKAVRPMGLGVQGFADVLHALRLPWTSPEARQFNVNLFAAIYWTAVKTSASLARELGPHKDWNLTDTGHGIFHPDHFDLSGPGSVKPENHAISEAEILRARLEAREYGMRNSYLIALMPTGTTSTILNASPSFDPILTNLYERDAKAGSSTVLRPEFVEDLRALGRWNDETRQLLVQAGGSLRLVKDLPSWMYEVYQTAHDIGMAAHQLSADRTPYVDQAQSHNTFMKNEDAIVRAFMKFFKDEKTFNYYVRALQLDAKESAVARSSSGSSNGAAGAGIGGGEAAAATEGAVCEPGCESCSG